MLSVSLMTTDTSEEYRNVAAVRCSVAGGPIKILPRHAPMLATLRSGKVYFVMASGGIEVHEISSRGLIKVEKDKIAIVS